MSDVLLGACIGFFASFLIFVFTSLFQWASDERKNNWQLERDERDRDWEKQDRQLERRLSVLDQRLIEARKYLSSSYRACTIFFKLEYTLINLPKPSDFLDMIKAYKDNYDEIHERNSVIFSLSDSKLYELNAKLSKVLITEDPHLKRLYEDCSNEVPIDKQKENERISEFMETVHSLQIDIQRRLDELSGFDT